MADVYMYAVLDRLLSVLRPIYQDLDGSSHETEMERVAQIARKLTEPTRDLELLLLLYPAAKWLEKPRNFSRLALAGDATEDELRIALTSLRRLGHPQTAEERAIASAIVIDRSGVRGLAESFAHARREGRSIGDVARDAIAETTVPEWMSDEAAAMLEDRLRARRAFCEALLAEL